MGNQTWVLIFTGLTAFATLCAAVAAVYGPYAAARVARRLEGQREQRNRKLWAFTTLMAHRLNWGQRDPSLALNMIDVLWMENKEVRDAWADFYRTLPEGSGYAELQKHEKFRTLLAAMAKDLDLADGFRPDDFARVYLSSAVAAQENAAFAMNMETINRAGGATSANTVNQSTGTGSGS